MGCGQPGHQPASCEEWRQWLQESDQDEAMLARWLLHSTKNCPQCKQRIERDKGCLHVKCKCGFHFCWQCLRDWRDHDETTGGFFQCHLQVDTTRIAAVFTAEEEEGRSRGGGVESKRDTFSSSSSSSTLSSVSSKAASKISKEGTKGGTEAASAAAAEAAAEAAAAEKKNHFDQFVHRLQVTTTTTGYMLHVTLLE